MEPTSSSPGRWSNPAALAVWAGAVVAVAVAPAIVVLASGRTFVWRDTATLFAPVRGMVVEALREGRLPLWNPYEGFGLPLFAQMIHGVLHPVSVAHAWLIPATGMEGLAVAYIGLAALGAWILARELGCSPAAAAIAGLAYGLSGYVQGLTAIIQLLAAGSTAPWAVAGIRAARRGSGGGLAAGVAGVAALHLAGDPQWTVAAVLLGLALTVDEGWRGATRGLASVAVGTGIAAIQLVPSWTFVAQSVRDSGISGEDQVQWALSPARLLEFFAPGFFQTTPGEDARAPVFLWLGGTTQWNLLIPFLSSVHVGAVVLALAVVGALRSRTGAILAAAAGVFLWTALGPALGAQQALREIPIWGSFRYSEKLVGPLTLCLSLLAALGAGRVAESPNPRRAGAFLGAGVGALVLGVVPLLPVIPRSGWGAPEATVERACAALASGLLLSGAGLALLGAAAWSAAHGGARRQMHWIVAGLVAVTSAIALPSALRAGRRYPANPTVVAGDPDPMVTRIATPLEIMPPANPLGLDAGDLEIFAKERMGIASMNVSTRVDQVAPTIGLIPRNLRLMGDAFGADVWPIMRRLGVSHVIFPETVDPAERAVVEVAVYGGLPVFHDATWGIHAWRVPHRPFAHFADEVSVVPSPEAAIEAVKLAHIARVPGTFVVGRGSWPAGRGEVNRVVRHADHVEVEARSDTDGLLVVADAYWPGWKASIDGTPTEILQADYLVRAVRWPAGRHLLRMSYDPPEVLLGWVVSGISLSLLLAVMAWLRWRPRGRDKPTPKEAAGI